MIITAIEQTKIDAVWNKLRTFADMAADYTYGRFTANDIRTALKNRPQQLWIAHEEEEVFGFVVTEFLEYPQMRVLLMHFTAGKELPLWEQPMLNALQEYARYNGCEAIESHGRAGWEKVFKDDGYKEKFRVYELPVECN